MQFVCIVRFDWLLFYDLENVKHMVLAIMTFSNIQQFQVKSTWNFLRFSNYALHYVLWFVLFNATFNNISVIVAETEVLGETTDLSQVTDKLYHIM